MEKITIDEFDNKFKLRRNPVKQNSPFDNQLLDFDEEELDYIEEQNPKNVWSLNESFIVSPGIKFKNVIGFFVCKEKWGDNQTEYSIK